MTTRNTTMRSLHECDRCGSEYSSVLAAALCCDDAAYGDMD